MKTRRATISLLIISLFMMVSGGGILISQARAQVTTAEIDGKITDRQGNPAPDVQLIAKNQETGAYQITYSQDNGEYHFHLLSPGLYEIMTKHLNYNTVVRKGVRLLVGQTSLVDFSLTKVDVQEKEVVVEAEAPLIDAKKSDLSIVIQPEQIQDLPLNSRNFLELAEIAPGAKVSTTGRGPVTTGAVNSRFITAYIDGGDFKNDDLGGVVGTSFGFTTNIVPEDAIKEFQVITSMYKAEYSKASGGVINAVTKEGGNEFHGSAFGLFRTEGLNARGSFETVPNPLTGKVQPDFNRQQYGFSIGGPIVMDQTHFFLAAERNTINNFFTVYTSGRRPSLDGTFKSPTAENQVLAKISHQFSEDNFLDLRLLDVSTDNTPGNFGGVSAFSNGFNLGFRVTSLLASDRLILGANTVNELRLQYERYRKTATPNSNLPEYFYQSSTIATGWNANQPQTEAQDKYQLRDDLEYILRGGTGTHALKGGVSLTREKFLSAAAFDEGAVFTFRTDTSAAPVQGTVGLGDPSTSAWNTAFGVYVQDDWNPIENLTLNLGLRWDVETNMINNGYVNPFGSDTALTNHVPANYIGNGNRKVDYGDVAPRVGFAYDLLNDRSTVFHGGFGLFYDRVIWNFASNELQNGKYNIYNVAFSSSAPATTDRATLINYVNNNIGGASAPSLTLFPSSIPTPYSIQWTLGVSRQLSPSLAVSLDYVSVRGRNEYTTYVLNYRRGATGPRTLTPLFGALGLVTPIGKSWYDGVEVGVTRPYQGDWQMQLSYTLSWAFNTFDDPFSNYVFQSSVLRAPSFQDERHRLVASGMVNLPLGMQVSGIFTFASPRPMIGSNGIGTISGVDNNNDGTTLDDYPVAGRNSIRPDPGKIRNWTKNLDLRITKYVDLLGGMRLAIIAEAFNFFNWTNYLTYVTTQSSRLYGSPNSALNPRQIQLGARLLF